MPTLAEIQKDPNFVNANAATKKAIFDKWSAQDPNFSGANPATQQAIRQKFGVIEAAADPSLTKGAELGYQAVGALGEAGKQAAGVPVAGAKAGMEMFDPWTPAPGESADVNKQLDDPSTYSRIGGELVDKAKKIPGKIMGGLESFLEDPLKGPGEALMWAGDKATSAIRDFPLIGTGSSTPSEAMAKGGRNLERGESVYGASKLASGVFRGAADRAATEGDTRLLMRSASEGIRGEKEAAGRIAGDEAKSTIGHAQKTMDAAHQEAANARKKAEEKALAREQTRKAAAEERRKRTEAKVLEARKSGKVKTAEMLEQKSKQEEARLAAEEEARVKSVRKVETALKESELPSPDDAEFDRPPGDRLGSKIRKRFLDEFEKAWGVRKESNVWKDYTKAYTEREARGEYFVTTQKGKAVLNDLRDIIKSRDPGSPKIKYSEETVRAAQKLFDSLVPHGEAGGKVAMDVVDEELRRLRKIQWGKEVEGYPKLEHDRAKMLADKLEGAMVDFVGEKNYPRPQYKGLSDKLNKFKNDIGHDIIGSQDIDYDPKNKHEWFKVNAEDLPKRLFGSAEGAKYALEMLPKEEVVQMADQYVANAMHGMKDSDAVLKWVESGNHSWLKTDEFASTQNKALNYAHSLAVQERNIGAIERVVAEQKRAVEQTAKAIRKFRANVPKQFSQGMEAAKTDEAKAKKFAEKQRLKVVGSSTEEEEKKGLAQKREERAKGEASRAFAEKESAATKKAAEAQKVDLETAQQKMKLIEQVKSLLTGDSPKASMAKYQQLEGDLLKHGVLTPEESATIKRRLADQSFVKSRNRIALAFAGIGGPIALAGEAYNLRHGTHD